MSLYSYRLSRIDSMPYKTNVIFLSVVLAASGITGIIWCKNSFLEEQPVVVKKKKKVEA